MATEMDPATVTTIINNINSLYGNLVSYTVGLILFVGAFVPAVISFFQRRQFNREYEELSKRMQNDLQVRVAEAENKMKARMEADQESLLKLLQAENKELESALRKEIGVMKGAASHLQAQQHEAYPPSCLDSCADALPRYLAGADERNARSIINLVKEATQKLNSSDFDDTSMDPGKSVESMIKVLEEHNVNGRYTHDVEEFGVLLKSAKARKKESKTVTPTHKEEATH